MASSRRLLTALRQCLCWRSRPIAPVAPHDTWPAPESSQNLLKKSDALSWTNKWALARRIYAQAAVCSVIKVSPRKHFLEKPKDEGKVRQHVQPAGRSTPTRGNSPLFSRRNSRIELSPPRNGPELEQATVLRVQYFRQDGRQCHSSIGRGSFERNIPQICIVPTSCYFLYHRLVLGARTRKAMIGVGLLMLSISGAYYYVITPHHSSAPPESVEGLLDRADSLAWTNRWDEAHPLYVRAADLAAGQRDPGSALYASVSELPVDESTSAPNKILQLNDALSKPEAQAKKIRLRVLTILGMTETNYDAGEALPTWRRCRRLLWSRVISSSLPALKENRE